MNLWKMFTSLFTTAGALSPLAIIVYAGIAITGVYGYMKIDRLTDELEAARQARVVQEAAQDKAETLNEARNDEREAKEIIDSGNFDNDLLRRLQSLD